MSPELNGVFAESWLKLKTGSNTDAAFRNITVCNYASGGINAYTVVLRNADSGTCNLTFYTDQRSPKVEQLMKDKQVTIIVHSDVEKLQLTLKGEAHIDYQNQVSQRCWQKDGYKGRRSYLAQPAPSTAIDEPADGLAYLQDKLFDEQDPAGYENFAVVTVAIQYLEYLKLNWEGNRRARFTLDVDKWKGVWLIP